MSPRLPSLRAAATEARVVLLRFPLVMAAALAAAVAGGFLTGATNPPSWLLAAMAAATLGLPLLVAVAVTAERLGSRRVTLALHAVAVAALVAVGLAWPHWTDAIRWRRYFQLSVAFHLLVAFLPYWRRSEPHGFWQWNRALFLRFLTAALFSGVLYVGLVVALMALNPLFKLRVGSHVFMVLWIGIAFVFNTWFFLGGLPRDLDALEERRDYPAQLKVFAQFILIPLVVVYLAILTAYLGRVLLTGSWPKGWIGWLVSSVAVAGILSLLLVHPVREREENRWVASYTRWFYVALLPSIGMLLAAIWQRVSQYGITEDRYFLSALALWLAAMAVAFIVRRDADIRLIPMTLCALALATLFGPWGAYGVSLRSQVAHVRRILSGQGMLEDGRVRAATRAVPGEIRRELGNTLTYLIRTHGASAAQAALGTDVPAPDSLRADGSVPPYGKEERAAAVAMRALGVDYVNSWESPTTTNFSYNDVYRGTVLVTPVSGARFHVRLGGMLPTKFTVDGAAWELAFDGPTKELRLRRPPDVTMVFPGDSLIALARSIGPLGPTRAADMPWLTADAADVRARLVPKSYFGRVESDGTKLDSFEGDLFLGARESP